MNPGLQPFVRESHPEIGFALMNGGLAVAPRKKTPEGQRERVRLLKRQGIRINASRLARERLRFGASTVAVDDLIDALACMTIARKIAAGKAVRFPAPGTEARDERGLLMEIWG
jgi:predicted RNase H-like nuclease